MDNQKIKVIFFIVPGAHTGYGFFAEDVEDPYSPLEI
jgi:hypothetical protein